VALALYLITAAALVFFWSRFMQRVTVAAALVLIALPLLFTGRAMFAGRVFAPVDLPFMAEPLHGYAQEYGVAQPHNILLSDLHCQIIPWQKAVRYSLANGEWPLWNPFILGGDILAAAAQPAVYDPLQWIGMLIPLPDAITFGAAMTFFLAGFFTWAFARALGLRESAAFVAAAGFMFCGMMSFFVGWPLGRAWAWLPLVLLATRRVVREQKPGMLACALALLIVTGHPESVLHVVFAGGLYGLYELGRVVAARRTISSIAVPSLLAAAAGVAALLITAVHLLPFAEAVPQTIEYQIRQWYAGTEYASMVKTEERDERILRTIVPGHRGKDPLSARVGPVVLALALFGVVARWRRGDVWFLTALALICLSATFGMRPVPHLLHTLPLFDIAINERLAFGAAFALAMLAAFAVDAVATRTAIGALLLAVVLLERSYEDGGVYPALSREAFFPRIPLIAAIPRDARMTAVGLTFTANDPAMYALEDVRGYEAMTFRRLHDAYPMWCVPQAAWFNRVDDLTRPFLSLLNVRYAIGQGDPPAGWRVTAEDRGTRLFESAHELPRAFVPRRIRYEREGQSVLAAMAQASDFSDLAWIEAPEYEPHEVMNGHGNIVTKRSGLGYELDAAMQSDGWVLVSTAAWKGWRAYVDGGRVETRFGDHAFVAVYVPRGTHRVTLDYLPESFTRGRNISLTTLAAAGLWMIRRRIRACRQSSSIS